MKYRIVEREYPNNGETKYVVEKQLYPEAEWTSVFTSADLEGARKVYDERISRAVVIDKVIVE